MPELKRIFGLVCLLVLSIGPIAIAGPRLIAEAGAGDRWGFASDLRVTAARCNGLFSVVSMCSVDYIEVNRADGFPQTLEYFTPGTWSGKKVLLMRSRSSPSVISASPAIANKRSRELLAVGWLIGGLALAFATFARTGGRLIGPNAGARSAERPAGAGAPNPPGPPRRSAIDSSAVSTPNLLTAGPGPFGRRGR